MLQRGTFDWPGRHVRNYRNGRKSPNRIQGNRETLDAEGQLISMPTCESGSIHRPRIISSESIRTSIGFSSMNNHRAAVAEMKLVSKFGGFLVTYQPRKGHHFQSKLTCSKQYRLQHNRSNEQAAARHVPLRNKICPSSFMRISMREINNPICKQVYYKHPRRNDFYAVPALRE